jgi:orotate phosphoribosyltransferase
VLVGALLDREEGAAEVFRARGYHYRSVFSIHQFDVAPR